MSLLRYGNRTRRLIKRIVNYNRGDIYASSLVNKKCDKLLIRKVFILLDTVGFGYHSYHRRSRRIIRLFHRVPVDVLLRNFLLQDNLRKIAILAVTVIGKLARFPSNHNCATCLH